MGSKAPTGISISFHDLTFTVQPKTGGPPLDILKRVSGEVLSSRVLAIMGASGAGKTTLLDVLAGQTYTGTTTGEVLVNGKPRRLKQFMRISSYVQQRDVLMASATVREAITTAALLKLPRSMTRAEKVQRVDQTLKELDLEACQNTLIGDELLNIKGISGGQRRRVSVGIELVKQPQLLFLDEPTSGLDSEMAVSLMDTLVKLARGGRTVCVTIHQPNSNITSKFDDFLLLTGGRVAYFGVWEEAIGVFAAAGYPCPNFTNPTDHFLNVLHNAEAADAVVATYAALPNPPGHASPGSSFKPATAAAGGDDLESGLAEDIIGEGSSDSAEGSPRPLPGLEQGKKANGKAEAEEVAGYSGSVSGMELLERPKASFLTQAYVLSLRMMRNWLRNPMMLVAEAMQYAFLAIFIGLVYLRLTTSVDTGVSDRLSSLWFSLAGLSFTPSYTSAVAWDSERLLLRRETGQGMYTPSAFFAAKTATVLPVQVFQTTLFCAITYWMVGYAPSAGRFFIYVAIFNLFQMTSETLGLLCALVTTRSMYAVIILTFVLFILISFTGFLVSAVPVYFRWVPKISYLTYAYTAVVENEFDGISFEGPEGRAIPGSTLVPSAVSNGLSVAENVAVVLGLTVGTRLLAYLVLLIVHRLKRI